MQMVFGKDWYYYLFLAFGHISGEMVQIVEDQCTAKKMEAESLVDRAPPPGLLHRLSKRSQAKALGMPLPPVQSRGSITSVRCRS